MSYQKDDGKGSYTPIDNGNGSNGHSSSPKSGSMKKWIIAGLVVVVAEVAEVTIINGELIDGILIADLSLLAGYPKPTVVSQLF